MQSNDYTTKELEEKFGVKIKFFDPYTAPLSLSFASGYYDWEEDIIYLSRYLSGKIRLALLAHEIGHKRHFDELVEKRMPLLKDGKWKVESECEAWKRGLPVAKELDAVERYRENWRSAWFPLGVVQECPFPGDDKVPHVSVGEGQEYSGKEWVKLMKEYIRTGKWLGRRHLGITEHIT